MPIFFAIFGNNGFLASTLPSLLLSPSLPLSLSLPRSLNQKTNTQYGAAVLAIELLGATTVLLYGVNLLLLPAAATAVATVDEATGLPCVSQAYHVRVLVPCYKESLDILRRTVVAARDAPLPLGCAGKTVYLCDDGRDPKKRKWVDALNDPSVVYVSGRQRPAGEMNGALRRLLLLLKQREREGKKKEKKGERKESGKRKLSFFLLNPFALNPSVFFLFSFFLTPSFSRQVRQHQQRREAALRAHQGPRPGQRAHLHLRRGPGGLRKREREKERKKEEFSFARPLKLSTSTDERKKKKPKKL